MTDQSGLDHDRLTSLWAVLACHAAANPQKEAMVYDGRRTTYGQLFAAARRLADLLAADGVEVGTRIGYVGKNCDLYFVLLFALSRVGAVMVPINWRLAKDEMSYIVADSTLERLFADAEFLPLARTLANEAGLPPARSIDDLAAAGLAHEATAQRWVREPLPTDAVFQVYTSGTTGRPKGAVLSNANLLALRAPGYRAGLSWFPMPESTSGVVLPIAHIAGTAYALFGFYAGGRIALLRDFEPGQVLQLIEQERVSHLLLAPAALQMVAENPSIESTDLSSLEVITYGAAPMPEALLRRALALFECGFVQMYGMTEAAGGVVSLHPDDHSSPIADRLRSAGRAMPAVEVAIVDDTWQAMPSGEIGEIAIRSPSIMSGYWQRPEATAEILQPDGWMRTGDIGRIDADGYVYVLDRAKDMIISGGENIYPAEVENAVFGHPDVSEVAIVSAPSDKWGEEVVAVIVPKEGRRLSLSELHAWLEGRLARFKFPKRIEFIDRLPRNAGNKIMRRDLRERFWEGRERPIS